MKNLDKLVATRNETLNLLSTISEDELHKPRRQSEWTLAQVFDHIYLSEKYFRDTLANLVVAFRTNGTLTRTLSFADLNVRPSFVPRALRPLFEVPLSVTNRIVPVNLVPRRVLRFFLSSPYRLARHPDVAEPRSGLTKDQLRSELEEIQETSDLIATNSDINFDRFRIVHPVFGSNSPNQFFEILSIHESGHLTRMNANLREKSKA